MKNIITSVYVFLVLNNCWAFGQFIGPPQPQPPHFQQQLSPQQQGHILSDIQQHQHRFSPPQPGPTFSPQQFNQQPFFHQPGHLTLLNQNQLLQQQNQQLLQAQQILESQLKNLNILQQSLPDNQLKNTLQTQSPAVQQHHTQTSFTPSFKNNETPSSLQPRPTVDPILSIEQEIRSLDPEKHKQRIKELKEKQAIIEKHNQFVEKQYEKALKKAREDHEQWLEGQKDEKKKLYQKLYKPPEAQVIRYMQSVPRYIYPEETPLFKKALEKYYEEHPTTTTTTTTTTPAPTTTTKKSIFNKKLGFLPTVVPTSSTSKVKTIQTLEDLNLLQKQYKQQQIARDDLLNQLKQAIGSSSDSDGKNLTSREISLADGKKIQLIQTTDPKLLPKGKPQEISLPNGQTVQVIRADDPKDEITLPSGQKLQILKPKPTVKTQEIVLPNGERVEIIRTSDPKLVPGATPLEPGSDLEKLLLARTTTPKTEILEDFPKDVVPPGADFELLKTGASGGLEQVQNITNKKVTFVLLEEQDDGTLKVRGVKGNGKDKPEVDVDSILKRIKNGEIKLPKPTASTIESTTHKKSAVSIVPNSFPPSDEVPVLKTNIGTNFVATSTPSATVYTKIFPGESSTTRPSSTTHKSPRNIDLIKQASSINSPSQNSVFIKAKPTTQPSVTIYKSISTTVPSLFEQHDLSEILKKNGLFAMAKFLKQSGLDTILNETGPYTVFVPTDKAFRTLLVQLGGPEKAEEKFKDNPRLLSGLLLHHVIPGAFTIGSLQDEMTGVSLAGTQLRVNQYNMHDLEWNDVKITTINGAKVMGDKQDIEIPQGIAHAVDRVMFPLPVGDILQTLQSDRERRFTTFLRALFSSGLADTLQGSKTFTLFAPTDKAFASLSTEELSKTISDRSLARDLILRHLSSGTLYTNGMRYYQIKDSLQLDKQLTLSKQSGKVKVNNIQLATQNIPATNGVIHAIDTLL